MLIHGDAPARQRVCGKNIQIAANIHPACGIRQRPFGTGRRRKVPVLGKEAALDMDYLLADTGLVGL